MGVGVMYCIVSVVMRAYEVAHVYNSLLCKRV